MLALALFGSGCSSSQAAGGQTGGENQASPTTPVCRLEQGGEALALTTDTPTGFSAADVMAGLASLPPAELEYRGGGTTSVTVGLQHTGISSYHEECHSLALDVSLSLHSADGKIQLTSAGTLLATSPDDAKIELESEAQSLGIDPAAFEPAAATHQAVFAKFTVYFFSSAAHGSFLLVGRDPNQPDQQYPIATF
jgi:hypothetical protein